MILTLARGHYCPKEHQQHLSSRPSSRRSRWPTPRSSRSRPTTTTRCRSSARRSAPSGLPLRPGRIVQKDLDIQEYTDPEHDPMIPHTLVLKPGLVVHSIYNGYWFWGRPSVDDLWRDLRAVDERVPPRLGSEHTGPSRGLGGRRPLALPRLGQVESGTGRGRARP